MSALDDEQSFFDAGELAVGDARGRAPAPGVRHRPPLGRFFEDPSVAAVSKVVEELLILEIDALTDDEAARLLEE
jgi:hypothetical protein